MHIERTVSLMAIHYCAQPAGQLAGEEIQDLRLDHKGSTSCFIYYLYTNLAFGEEIKNYFK